MTDFLGVFDISASGMHVEKVRLDTVALNLANANTTRTAAGGPYQPKTVVVGEKSATGFAEQMNQYVQQFSGAEVVDIVSAGSEPTFVHDPSHPDAQANGMVAYPNINMVTEMVNMMSATRSYEANIQALNAAKTMLQRALEIGEN